MTDELLYERLALSIAQTGSPLPTLHGEHVGVFAQLYPLLLSPVYLVFAMPVAVLVAHGWNGLLFASATVPAYLLARRVVPEWMAVACAIGTVALPWSVLSGFLMTENAAYPAFLWAVLAMQRAVVEPGDRPDAVALGVIALAALARPQLAVLGAVFVIAALAEELRFGKRWRAHRVLIGACALALLVALVAAVLGSAGSLLGSYAPTLEEGSLVSRAGLRSAAVHFDVVAVAIGIVPLLLGGGWALETLARGGLTRESHALAAVVVTTSVLLTLEVGSFVARFGLGLDVKDRYLFYLVPLLLIATASALLDRARVAGVLAVTVLFVLTVGWEQFEPVFGVNLDSPGSVLHEWFARNALDAGVSTTHAVAGAGGALAVAVVLALRALPRAPVAFVVLAGVVLFTGLEAGFAWGRLLNSAGPSGGALSARPTDAKSWIDRAVPTDADVGMLAYSVGQEWYPSAIAWWNVEFWNARVTHAYMVDGWFTYTPATFPRPRLRVDLASGALDGAESAYLARTTLDARFAPAGEVVGIAPDLEVVRLEQPPRAAWVTRRLAPDGWTRANTPALLRIYGNGPVDVRITVSAPEVKTLREFSIGPAAGALGPTGSRDLAFRVCPRGHVDLAIRAEGSTPVRKIPLRPPFAEQFRFVGVRLSRIATEAASGSC